ncbi:hypothetical protein Q8A67_023677 [Cirrhinus molitorella]|uniref:Uncharacterized protein n=1 Tax=Cirrhinus molitorella TaxID=172907 RepID=A0AA88P0B5_9TELE|nr:hypothetical protein Q8A67_023677 [Cirrhinus molitorella]
MRETVIPTSRAANAWGKEQGLKSPQSPALLHRVEQDYGAFNRTPRQTERKRAGSPNGKEKRGGGGAESHTGALQPFLSTPETNGQKLPQLMRTTYKP